MKDFSIALIVILQCLFLLSCKENIVSYEKQLFSYGETINTINLIESHKIHFSLPSKYKLLGVNGIPIPTIYCDRSEFLYKEMRENIYIADTLKYNWFYYAPAVKIADTIDVLDFTKGSLSQLKCMECTGQVYDVIVDKLENGNEKYVFIAFCPSKSGIYGCILKNENVGIDLYIDCLIKTKDDYCMVFSIRSFEFLKDFNYQEKLDIINSIYVE